MGETVRSAQRPQLAPRPDRPDARVRSEPAWNPRTAAANAQARVLTLRQLREAVEQFSTDEGPLKATEWLSAAAEALKEIEIQRAHSAAFPKLDRRMIDSILDGFAPHFSPKVSRNALRNALLREPEDRSLPQDARQALARLGEAFESIWAGLQSSTWLRAQEGVLAELQAGERTCGIVLRATAQDLPRIGPALAAVLDEYLCWLSAVHEAAAHPALFRAVLESDELRSRLPPEQSKGLGRGLALAAAQVLTDVPSRVDEKVVQGVLLPLLSHETVEWVTLGALAAEPPALHVLGECAELVSATADAQKIDPDLRRFLSSVGARRPDWMAFAEFVRQRMSHGFAPFQTRLLAASCLKNLSAQDMALRLDSALGRERDFTLRRRYVELVQTLAEPRFGSARANLHALADQYPSREVAHALGGSFAARLFSDPALDLLAAKDVDSLARLLDVAPQEVKAVHGLFRSLHRCGSTGRIEQLAGHVKHGRGAFMDLHALTGGNAAAVYQRFPSDVMFLPYNHPRVFEEVHRNADEIEQGIRAIRTHVPDFEHLPSIDIDPYLALLRLSGRSGDNRVLAFLDVAGTESAPKRLRSLLAHEAGRRAQNPKEVTEAEVASLDRNLVQVRAHLETEGAESILRGVLTSTALEPDERVLLCVRLPELFAAIGLAAQLSPADATRAAQVVPRLLSLLGAEVITRVALEGRTALVRDFALAYGLESLPLLFRAYVALRLGKPAPRDVKALGVAATGSPGVQELRAAVRRFQASLFSEGPAPKFSALQLEMLTSLAKVVESEWGDGNTAEAVKSYNADYRAGVIAPLASYHAAATLTVKRLDAQSLESFPYSSTCVAQWDQLGEDINAVVGAKPETLLSEVRDLALKAIAGSRQKRTEKQAGGNVLEELDQLANAVAVSRDMDALLTALTDSSRRAHAFLNPALRRLAIHRALQQMSDVQQILGATRGPPTRASLSRLAEFFSNRVREHVVKGLPISTEARNRVDKACAAGALTDELKRIAKLVAPGREVEQLEAIPTRGLLGELSGYISDACWPSDHLLRDHPRLAPYILRSRGDTSFERLGGAFLVLQARTDGRRSQAVLVLRAINPQQTRISRLDVADYVERNIALVEELARKAGAQLVVLPMDGCSMSMTNRPDVANYILERYQGAPRVRLANSPEVQFNGYDLRDICVVVRRVDGER
ncbi:MAG: hypothetical protein ACKVPX_06145 [Myxococcaceae bacterium]